VKWFVSSAKVSETTRQIPYKTPASRELEIDGSALSIMSKNTNSKHPAKKLAGRQITNKPACHCKA